MFLDGLEPPTFCALHLNEICKANILTTRPKERRNVKLETWNFVIYYLLLAFCEHKPGLKALIPLDIQGLDPSEGLGPLGPPWTL